MFLNLKLCLPSCCLRCPALWPTRLWEDSHRQGDGQRGGLPVHQPAAVHVDWQVVRRIPEAGGCCLLTGCQTAAVDYFHRWNRYVTSTHTHSPHTTHNTPHTVHLDFVSHFINGGFLFRLVPAQPLQQWPRGHSHDEGPVHEFMGWPGHRLQLSGIRWLLYS